MLCPRTRELVSNRPSRHQYRGTPGQFRRRERLQSPGTLQPIILHPSRTRSLHWPPRVPFLSLLGLVHMANEWSEACPRGLLEPWIRCTRRAISHHICTCRRQCRYQFSNSDTAPWFGMPALYLLQTMLLLFFILLCHLASYFGSLFCRSSCHLAFGFPCISVLSRFRVPALELCIVCCVLSVNRMVCCGFWLHFAIGFTSHSAYVCIGVNPSSPSVHALSSHSVAAPRNTRHCITNAYSANFTNSYWACAICHCSLAFLGLGSRRHPVHTPKLQRSAGGP